MALRDQPYLPLYIQDFLTDEKLIECSAAATGVYIRVMCIMHKSDEYGTVLLRQKDKQGDNQIHNFALKIGKQLPYDSDTVENCLTELIDEGVLTLDGDILFQKRMVRDNEISLMRSEAGRKGGEKTQIALKSAKAKNKAKPEYEIENENEDNFELFWKKCDWNSKGSKKAAFDNWKKLKKELPPLEDLIFIIKRQLDHKKESDKAGEFCAEFPHVERWLKKRRWEDDIPDIKNKSGFGMCPKCRCPNIDLMENGLCKYCNK